MAVVSEDCPGEPAPGSDMRRVADSGDGSVPVVLVGDFNAPSHLDWRTSPGR